jgi:hypothetical protein
MAKGKSGKGRKQEADEEKPKIERASLVRGGYIIETVFYPGKKPPMHYVIFRDDRPGEPLYKCDAQFGQGDDADVFIPPRDPYGMVPAGCVRLASHLQSYGSRPELRDEIRGFIHRYAQMPEMAEEVATQYVLMSWVYDRFSAVPYLRFLDPHGSGKTRCLETIGSLSYKGIFAGGATTASPLFRLLDVWRGTALIDEADFKDSEAWVDIIKILNQGYSDGFPVLRSEGDSHEPRPFHVFGPKIISNRSRFQDPALESRCLTFEIGEQRLREDIPRNLCREEFNAGALEIRNKLLAFRINTLRSIRLDESALLELEPRRTQIAAPLYSVADDPEFRQRFVAFLEASERDDRSDRPEAVVVEAIRRLVERGQPTLSVKDVALYAEEVSEDWAPGQSFHARRVGHLVRSLGFKPERTRTGYQFRVDSDQLKCLIEKYGAEDVRPCAA